MTYGDRIRITPCSFKKIQIFLKVMSKIKHSKFSNTYNYLDLRLVSYCEQIDIESNGQ